MRTNVKHKQCRNGACDKQAAPAEERKHNPIDNRREEISESITLLQDSREESAGLSRQRFHCKRRTQSPFTAHADAVKSAENQQHSVIGRKRRQQFHDGIKNDIDHQREPASKAVAEQTEDECSCWAHRERDRNRVSKI